MGDKKDLYVTEAELLLRGVIRPTTYSDDQLKTRTGPMLAVHSKQRADFLSSHAAFKADCAAAESRPAPIRPSALFYRPLRGPGIVAEAQLRLHQQFPTRPLVSRLPPRSPPSGGSTPVATTSTGDDNSSLLPRSQQRAPSESSSPSATGAAASSVSPSPRRDFGLAQSPLRASPGPRVTPPAASPSVYGSPTAAAPDVAVEHGLRRLRFADEDASQPGGAPGISGSGSEGRSSGLPKALQSVPSERADAPQLASVSEALITGGPSQVCGASDASAPTAKLSPTVTFCAAPVSAHSGAATAGSDADSPSDAAAVRPSEAPPARVPPLYAASTSASAKPARPPSSGVGGLESLDWDAPPLADCAGEDATDTVTPPPATRPTSLLTPAPGPASLPRRKARSREQMRLFMWAPGSPWKPTAAAASDPRPRAAGGAPERAAERTLEGKQRTPRSVRLARGSARSLATRTRARSPPTCAPRGGNGPA